MNFKNIFVTVGTTEFNQLIESFTKPEINDILNNLGCKYLTLQIGKGKEFLFDNLKGIKVEVFSLKTTINEEIKAADLVISHAGAGTCIDVLTQGKPLVVVINETLMNNHQSELAEQLANDEYLIHTNVDKLPETLKTLDVTKLKKYEKGNVDKFIEHLDQQMGFN